MVYWGYCNLTPSHRYLYVNWWIIGFSSLKATILQNINRALLQNFNLMIPSHKDKWTTEGLWCGIVCELWEHIQIYPCILWDQKWFHMFFNCILSRNMEWFPILKHGFFKDLKYGVIRTRLICINTRLQLRDASSVPPMSECRHYYDVIMGTIASQITSLTIVYSGVYSDADQSTHQSSASLAFVREIHRGRWISRTNGQ